VFHDKKLNIVKMLVPPQLTDRLKALPISHNVIIFWGKEVSNYSEVYWKK